VQVPQKVVEPISYELKRVILDIAEKSDFEIIEIDSYKDYIHLLVKSEHKR
jgi:putative transposase